MSSIQSRDRFSPTKEGRSMGNNIMMVGDDGNVYHVDPKNIGKIAKKVPLAKLSKPAQEHIVRKVAGTHPKGVAHIFASKANIFTATKADIFIAGKSDLLGSAKAHIFVSKKKAGAAKADIFMASKKSGAKADIFVSGKKG